MRPKKAEAGPTSGPTRRLSHLRRPDAAEVLAELEVGQQEVVEDDERLQLDDLGSSI
jgi:hypothetical protein